MPAHLQKRIPPVTLNAVMLTSPVQVHAVSGDEPGIYPFVFAQDGFGLDFTVLHELSLTISGG